MATDVKKLSFAKVAASGTKEAPTAPAVVRSVNPTTPKERRNPISPAAHVVRVTSGDAHVPDVSQAPGVTSASNGPDSHETPSAVADSKVVEELRDLKLETKTPSLVVNGTGSTVTERSSKVTTNLTPFDDVSPKADSASDLGTKPPSLDGKSIASGMTFALDEKESLRPDDSASVKAAAEDDDAVSIRGSLIAGGSRVGSEVAARVHRIQLGDMPPRIITTQMFTGTNSHGPVGLETSSIEKTPVADGKLSLGTATVTADVLNGNGFMYRQNPDEKLLEAMQSPKDRLFLLRLESQVIEFVQDSKEPFMDLPPCNSFCRMLTHKLADYYHMTHSFEAVAGAVRIYRTPFCRVPPPLSSIAVSTTNTSSPTPAVLPRKIMRRDRDGDLGTQSTGPSKPASEVGSDSKDRTGPTKDKLTREEREEAYNRARERIFGSVEKTENSTPDNDDSNGVSRASSVSVKDKTAQPKRKTAKQRRDDSESFDSRSQYVPWCGPQQQTWVAPQYVPVGNVPFNAQYQQPKPTPPPPVVAPNQGLTPMMPSGYPVYSASPPVYYPHPAPQFVQPVGQQQRYPPPAALPTSFGGAVPAVPQPGWQQHNASQSPYLLRATPAPTSAGIPYPYGQLPVNVNPNDPKSQHPIPGSYNRHAFNPRTQSFVPANNMAPVPTPAVPPIGYGAASPHQGSPQLHVPHLNYNGYQQPMSQAPYMVTGSGYGMVRQGSNNSLPPYPPAQMPSQPTTHGAAPGATSTAQPPHMANKPGAPQGSGQAYGSLPTYGNPASLPQKPTVT
ncbi:hypothetical protein VTK73DRAFT_6718 [Phialemonium thermophilum]|uniref:R3H domain-containing protein n=1 Tax=Phialemonium thermophilum TaxID=223376 RepID=A0ABR3XV60_9PEZI